MTKATIAKPVITRARKMAREPEQKMPSLPGSDNEGVAITPVTTPPKPQTKSALVVELLGRPDGATIDQLAAATGWLPHTTRAMLTGLKKKGHTIASEKAADSPRIYRIGAKAEAA